VVPLRDLFALPSASTDGGSPGRRAGAQRRAGGRRSFEFSRKFSPVHRFQAPGRPEPAHRTTGNGRSPKGAIPPRCEAYVVSLTRTTG